MNYRKNEKRRLAYQSAPILKKNKLLLFMSVFSQTFFAFVGGHFMTFSFFTAWHNFF